LLINCTAKVGKLSFENQGTAEESADYPLIALPEAEDNIDPG
jgi:hypothetical protein